MDYKVIKKLQPHVDLHSIPARKTIFRENRYHVMHGGRGGGKSVFVSDTLALEGYLSKKRILCAREIQKSISESVMASLWDSIVKLGLDDFYTKTKTEILGANGTLFMFMGLRTNITNVKSIANIDFVWCEEAENITAESWKVLLPSIRANGSRIIITFNPAQLMDATYQKFVVNPPTDSIVTKICYYDNPFFPEVLEKERRDMEDADPELYEHVWGGSPVADSNLAIVPPNWIRACVDIHKFLGIDETGAKQVGFDVSDEGDDPNANAFISGIVIKELREWKDRDPNSAANQTWQNLLEFGGERVIFDSIGVGAGAKGELRREVESMRDRAQVVPEIQAYDASGSVENKRAIYNGAKPNEDMFLNAKAQDWWKLRDAAHNAYKARKGKDFDSTNLISFDSESIDPKMLEKCLAEISSPRREYQGGKVKVESKDKMKKDRGIPSTNLADAVIMARKEPASNSVFESIISMNRRRR